jgi:hypothetical protein
VTFNGVVDWVGAGATCIGAKQAVGLAGKAGEERHMLVVDVKLFHPSQI